MNEIQLECLKKEAKRSDFYESLLNQFYELGELSEKQMVYVEQISKKKEEAIKNSRKLTEF